MTACLLSKASTPPCRLFQHIFHFSSQIRIYGSRHPLWTFPRFSSWIDPGSTVLKLNGKHAALRWRLHVQHILYIPRSENWQCNTNIHTFIFVFLLFHFDHSCVLLGRKRQNTQHQYPCLASMFCLCTTSHSSVNISTVCQIRHAARHKT